ncbi:hypothetical protein [Fulvivirga lutimaris]|uniref:hypothetical protein n=1 Tax=Fulvivirga lutimaris TaxID=1819566 RepID=UPI0012BB8090|nr:hypothetical protein [Fulvivirga lutimaris]MTI40662.1 hypothetical protein [Fulvivirga lutimaris]
MNQEVSQIIKDRSFKYDRGDYFALFFTLLASIPIAFLGVWFLIEGSWPNETFFGLLVGLGMTALVIRSIIRFKKLNKFQSLRTELSQQENFEFLVLVMKSLDVKEVDNDYRNKFLSIKLSKHYMPTWISLIALENEILINERANIHYLFWKNGFDKEIVELILDKINQKM